MHSTGESTGAAGRGLSIVIPTLNETGNLPPLLNAIEHLNLCFPWEAVIVDDGSIDGTLDEVKSLARELPVTLIERGRKLGLASAVVTGAERASYDVILVMDADGSHPVESIPGLVTPVMEGHVPMAVGSRYVEDGRIEDWPLSRLVSSRLATMTALPVSPVKDPMSGFFAVRKSAVKWEELRPRGFKIGLEIMCRSLFDDVLEVPIVFRDREAGHSKMNLKVLTDYILQVFLLSLYMLRRGRFRFGQFVLVGLGGMAVDYAVFAVLFSGLGVNKVYAQTASFACAVLNNFFWNRRWTFRVRHGSIPHQLMRFVTVALYAFLLRSILFYWITESAGVDPYLGLFAGIAAATLANYFGSAGYAFRKDASLSISTAWQMAVFLILLKLLYGAYIDLVPEEAYYWTYARHLALSYFDHPPLCAWSIRLATLVFGDTEFAVRLVGAVYGLLGCLGIYLLARDWYGDKVAALSVLAYPLLPMGFAYSFLATPDSPLVPMCLLAAWAAGRAARNNNRWFLLVGVFGGLGGLAKYSIAVVPVGLLIYALWERKFISWLLSGWVWLGILVSVLLVSPVIVWNYQHEWASFAFQFARRLADPEAGRNESLYNLGAFLGYQFGALSPLLPFAGTWGIIRSLRSKRKKHRLFLSVGLAFVVGFMLYSLRGATKPNWTLPGLLLLAPTVLCTLYESRDRLAKAGRWAVRWSILLLALVYAAGMYHLVFLLPGTPPIRKMDGWREMGKEVKKLRRKINEKTGREPLIIGADRYHVAVEAAFYADAPYNTAGYWAVGGPYALNFRYWLDLQDFKGTDIVYIDRERSREKAIERLSPYVDEVVAAAEFISTVQGREAQRFFIVHGTGYRPPDKNPREK